MKAFLSLFKIYSSGGLGLSGFLDSFKKGPKGVAKGLGVILLALYVVASLGLVFLMSDLAKYRALDAMDMRELFPLVFMEAVIRASFIAFFLGFVNALATYFLSDAETFLISLPLRPPAHFGAKFALSWLTQVLLSAIIVLIGAGLWAWHERPAPAFYPYALLVALAVPLIPLALSYLVLVPLLSAVKFLRKKERLVLFAGIIGLGLALAWQLSYQKSMMNAADGAWLVKEMSDPLALMNRFGALYPPAPWAAAALEWAARPSGLGYAALFLLVQGLAALLAVAFLSRPYVRSLASFNESGMRALKDAAGYIGKGFGKRGRLSACLLREMRLMNREPLYFLNGPFIIFLLPLILTVSFLAAKEEYAPLLPYLSDPLLAGRASSVIMAMAAFLGTATSIACSAVSREGKGLSFLKSLPLSPRAFFLAKYLHAEIFAALAALIVGAAAALLGLLPQAAALGALSGFFLASLLNLLDLSLDTAFPRLDWSSPVGAMKQNPNTLIAVLGGMALCALACLPGILGGMDSWTLIAGAASLALSALGLALYLPWAEGRFRLMGA